MLLLEEAKREATQRYKEGLTNVAMLAKEQGALLYLQLMVATMVVIAGFRSASLHAANS